MFPFHVYVIVIHLGLVLAAGSAISRLISSQSRWTCRQLSFVAAFAGL